MPDKNIKELLVLADETFKLIHKAASEKDFTTCFNLLNYPQPIEWISKAETDDKKSYYYYNKIELIESIMHNIFDVQRSIETIPLVTSGKGGYSITNIEQIVISFRGDKDSTPFHYSGIASVFSPSLEMMTLATPKCSTMAFKDACAKIGAFLGKGINRHIENAEPKIPGETIDPREEEFNKEFNEIKNKINDCETKEEAESILNKSTFKLNPELKKIVKSK